MKQSTLIDAVALDHWCSATASNFDSVATRFRTPGGSRYWWKDNGSRILAVAHIDSVQPAAQVGDTVAAPHRFYNPCLDDRLGVYTILDLLPRIGIRCDVLLCDDEEYGRSTAGEFASPKDYAWIVEFDRAGGDVVTYQYEDDAWLYALKASGFNIGWGTYSDISCLSHLGACAVNIGVGYQDYHSPRAYFDVGTYCKQLRRFHSFYHRHKASEFPYVEKRGSKYDWYDEGDYLDYNSKYRPRTYSSSGRTSYWDPKDQDRTFKDSVGRTWRKGTDHRWKVDEEPNPVSTAIALRDKWEKSAQDDVDYYGHDDHNYDTYFEAVSLIEDCIPADILSDISDRAHHALASAIASRMVDDDYDEGDMRNVLGRVTADQIAKLEGGG